MIIFDTHFNKNSSTEKLLQLGLIIKLLLPLKFANDVESN